MPTLTYQGMLHTGSNGRFCEAARSFDEGRECRQRAASDWVRGARSFVARAPFFPFQRGLAADGGEGLGRQARGGGGAVEIPAKL